MGTITVLKTCVIATGMVYGELWGGGYAAYPARAVEGDSVEKVEEAILRELKSGGLDSGMGFKYLKGAYMVLVEISEVMVDDEYGELVRQPEDRFYGSLTEEEQEFTVRSYVQR